jgi:hypothetical protein
MIIRVEQEIPSLLYTKTGYITLLYVGYKDNLNCRPANFNISYLVQVTGYVLLIERFEPHLQSIFKLTLHTSGRKRYPAISEDFLAAAAYQQLRL